MINKSNFSIFFLIVSTLIATGCSESLLINEDKVFRYNEHSNISSLDPIYSSTLRNIWPVNQIFNGLVQLNDSLKIKPDIVSMSLGSPTYSALIHKKIKTLFYHSF
jgi:ABC-type oligopeptide transport system substrate-binding subunit